MAHAEHERATGLNDLSATVLAAGIRSGQFSAAEALAAHEAQIARVNPRLNALILPTFDQAREAAGQVDAARARGEPLGPLAGVPVSIKECFHVAGTPTTIGLPHFAGTVAPCDAPLVARLREAGAIVLGKTNVPQLLLMHETDNPVYGRTLNPWNTDRSPGGSSGGEAALIAARGSALGLANDLGGSIRQPAHSCGICGLKPTTGRLPIDGILSNLNGMEAVVGQPGPLARTVDDLSLAMSVLVDARASQADTAVAPVPWADPGRVELDKLRIGMWTFDGFFHPAPAVRRAVDEAAAVLSACGVTVEPVEPPDVAEAMELYFRLLSADGGADARRLIAGDPMHSEIKQLMLLGRLPAWLRPPLGGFLRMVGQRRMASMLLSTGPSSADGYWQATYRRRQYCRRFMAALDARRLDGILCPVHALPALKHGSFIDLISSASYSMLTNLLGIPVGTVPVTCVRAGEESDQPASHDLVDRAARAVEADSAGLPIGVQIGARPWREDVVLALMKAIEQHMRGRANYPARPPGC